MQFWRTLPGTWEALVLEQAATHHGPLLLAPAMRPQRDSRNITTQRHLSLARPFGWWERGPSGLSHPQGAEPSGSYSMRSLVKTGGTHVTSWLQAQLPTFKLIAYLIMSPQQKTFNVKIHINSAVLTCPHRNQTCDPSASASQRTETGHATVWGPETFCKPKWISSPVFLPKVCTVWLGGSRAASLHAQTITQH